MALDKIVMTEKATKFCVSWVTCNVTKYVLTEIQNKYFYHFVLFAP